MTFATRLRQFALAALAAVTVAPSAQALTYTDGDLILGFRATGGQGATKCYEVNIGQASTYAAAANPINVDLSGEISSDLTEIFGSDWSTRSDVYWSVAGVQFTASVAFPLNRTLFASRGEN